MVARYMRGVQPAGNLAEYIAEQGNSVSTPKEADLVPGHFPFVQLLFLLRPRKEFRPVLLIFFEDVYAEHAAIQNLGQKMRAFVHTDGDERRLERNRSEGIGGHAVNPTRSAFDGHNRYTCRELAEGAAKVQ